MSVSNDSIVFSVRISSELNEVINDICVYTGRSRNNVINFLLTDIAQEFKQKNITENKNTLF